MTESTTKTLALRKDIKPETSDSAVAPSLSPAHSRIEGVILLTERLTGLLTTELDLIKARDGKAIEALLKEKKTLVLEYQKAIKTLMGERNMLADLPSALRETLREAGRKLDAAAERNSQSLNLAAAATQKVLQVIVDAVRKEMKTHQGYNNPRGTRKNWSRCSPTAPPLNINRTF